MSDKLYSQVARGLQQEPALLFAFGVSLLVAGGAGGFAWSGASSGHQLTAFLVAGLGLMGFALTAISLVMKGRQREPKAGSVWAEFEFENVVDGDLRERLANLVTCVTEAAAVEHQSFRKAVISRIDDYLMESSAWKKGEVRDVYGHFDLASDVFKNAKTSVFSTSVPEFLGFWSDSAKGGRLLEAHQASTATVTRVFVFDTRDEIDEKVRKAIEAQTSTGKINALIYVDGETAFDWPPHITKDFTIVDDGAVIGVAATFRGGEVIGSWYFETKETYNSFDAVRKRLLAEAKPLSEFFPESR